MKLTYKMIKVILSFKCRSMLLEHTQELSLLHPSVGNMLYNNICWLLQLLLDAAIPTVVTIAEALKRDGLASHKGKRSHPFYVNIFYPCYIIRMTGVLDNATEIKISTVNSKEDQKGHFIQKAKVGLISLATGFCLFYLWQFWLFLWPVTIFPRPYLTVSDSNCAGKGWEIQQDCCCHHSTKGGCWWEGLKKQLDKSFISAFCCCRCYFLCLTSSQ